MSCELGVADAKSPSNPAGRARKAEGRRCEVFTVSGERCGSRRAPTAATGLCRDRGGAAGLADRANPGGFAAGWGGCTTPPCSAPARQSSVRGLILPAQAPSAPARPRSRGWVGSRVTLPFPSRRGARHGCCQPDRGGSRSPCQSTCVGPPAPARSRRAKPGSAPRARPPQPDVIPRPVPPGCGRSRAQRHPGRLSPPAPILRSGGDGAAWDPPAPVSALCPGG